MSKCCKCAKWFPHNWLCLKGLSIVFLAFFYIAIAWAIYQVIAIAMHPAITGRTMWMAMAYYVLSDLAAAIGFLTVAKILKVLRKIEHAVAPCCCNGRTEEKTEETK